MKADSGRKIIAALNQAGARYLIVGGLAVVAHGYLRYTVGVDLVIALDTENTRRSMKALARLGYKPRVPVRIEDFADPELRNAWVRDKGMVVFQLVSDEHLETPVDVFVTEPFDFTVQYQRASRHPVLGGEDAPVLALDELLAMKRQLEWLEGAQQLVAEIHGWEAALLPSGSTVTPRWYKTASDSGHLE